MQIWFDVAGVPAEFRRNTKTGRAELQVGDDVMRLQSPYRLSAHMELGTRKVWRRRVDEHEIVIVKARPRMYGGLRENSFTISVDDVVAEATGK